MEPHGYNHLICFFSLGLLLSYLPRDMMLTCRRKEKSERLLSCRLTVVQIFFVMRHAFLPFVFSPLSLSFTVSMFPFHREKLKRRPKACARRGKADGLLVWLGFDVTASTPATYQRHRL